jgi:histidinol-phosphate aminotransferase
VSANLHLNEMPQDIPAELKRRILERFESIPLNRYPEPFADSLVHKLAGWYGCDPGQLLVAPGSSAFIRLLLTYFGLQSQGRLVITRPSFAYYEEFCQAFGLKYDTWELDDTFQYDITLLDDLPAHSAVFLTTPNNPTGNLMPTPQIETLLRRHPQSLFVVDEAYAEFTPQNLLSLLQTHNNLLLLRTFSKAFGVAGLRCGALIGTAPLIKTIAALQTPWQLSSFTIEAAKVILDYTQETRWINDRLQAVIAERERLFRACTKLAVPHFTIYPSEANFLLLQAHDVEAHAALLSACGAASIRVSDLGQKPRLSQCIRITIGTPDENRLFLGVFKQAAQKLPKPTAAA